MRKSTLVAVLIVAFLVAIGTIIQDVRFDDSLARTEASTLARDRQIGTLDVTLSDLRAAETGYLATGQGPDFWMHRATDLADQISQGLEELRAATMSGDARPHYEAAAGALTDLMSVDKRARDDIQGDQRFLASDLIFVDGLDADQRLSGELAAARTAETKLAGAETTDLGHWRLATNVGAVGLLLFGLCVLYFNPATVPHAASEAAAVAQMIRELPPAVKPAGARPASAAPTPPATVPAAAPPPPPVPVVGLVETADLCVDLARVIDGRDIPALLGRAARVLEAKGIIVWVVDTGRTVLRPSLVHGYPDKVITKLGTLDVEADNVTSLSFRSMRPQSMNGAAPGAPGAIAVPLVTTAGCTGVLAAEVRDNKPSAEMIALAKIIAAQFATLIAPADVADAQAVQA